MKPELHYGEDDCPVKAPDAFPRDDELHFEIEMIDFFKVKVGSAYINSFNIVFCMLCTFSSETLKLLFLRGA